MMPKKVFGIFSGGGAKGAAFVGAVEQASKHVEFVGWGGTSAGSIIAALLACGFTPLELRDRLTRVPLSRFFEVNAWMVIGFSHYKGLADPKPLLDWLRAMIKEKYPHQPFVTFEHITRTSRKPLKIVATNVSKRDVEVFSYKTTPNKEIAQAVLASCSFPVLFPPHKDGEFELVDGGVLSNFPMWLFHDEEELFDEFTPVLGFTLFSRKTVLGGGLFAHFSAVFDSLVAAQDRVQERYLDVARLSNVIRIDVTAKETFPREQTLDQQNSLILAGTDAALNYFQTASDKYGEPVKVPFTQPCTIAAQTQYRDGNPAKAVSTIARHHLLHGGIARDSGFSDERVIVRYYINLMEAVTHHDNLEILADILVSRIRDLQPVPTRVVGLKKGNSILAYEVARKLQTPLSIFKSDMSYKMGPPFDGRLRNGDKVVLVDDFASDASILMHAVRYLLFFKVSIVSVVVLVERDEGDARDRLQEKNVQLRSICRADDIAIQKLIDEDTSLPSGQRSTESARL